MKYFVIILMLLCGCEKSYNNPVDPDAIYDCLGTFEGDALEDNCGTCDSDSSNDCSLDCNNVWGGNATLDVCGTCDANPQNDCTEDEQDNSTACQMPDLSIYIEGNTSVYYNSSIPIAGFQFNVDGTTVLGASGGVAEDVGFSVSTGSSTVLAFSFSGSIIPAGCGTLINIQLNGTATGLSGMVFSNSSGSTIPITYYTGN